MTRFFRIWSAWLSGCREDRRLPVPNTPSAGGLTERSKYDIPGYFSLRLSENMASISLLDMVLALSLSFLLGLFLFLVYKKTYAGVMYSASFGVTLIAMAMITTVLIMTVVSNVVLSLGMVGALSIVRFRTAIKEPMDIAFSSGVSRWESCWRLA